MKQTGEEERVLRDWKLWNYSPGPLYMMATMKQTLWQFPLILVYLLGIWQGKPTASSQALSMFLWSICGNNPVVHRLLGSWPCIEALPFFFRLFVRRRPQLACWTLTLALLITNLAGVLLALNYKNLSLFSCLCYKSVVCTVGLSPYLLQRITPASSLHVIWKLYRVRAFRNPKSMSFMRSEGKLGWGFGRKRLDCLKSSLKLGILDVPYELQHHTECRENKNYCWESVMQFKRKRAKRSTY